MANSACPRAFFIVTFLASIASNFILSQGARITSDVGINYGQLGNNLPAPDESVELIKCLRASTVKIYDANSKILKALRNTDLRVSIMVPNELIVNMSTDQNLANQWVRTNVAPYYPDTKIRTLLVGNEILSNPDEKVWLALVPAMRKIKYTLKRYGLHKIRVGTPSAMDVLATALPPSNGSFRSDISTRVMKPMLKFLNRTKSCFFLDVYPYFAWASNPKNIKLDYALLKDTNQTYTDPVSGLTYNNLLDQMLDAVASAMKRVGYPDIGIWIAETGWPNAGDFDQIGANIYNAATYNRNVIKKLTTQPPVGTPARPGWALPSFLFSLYNENKKPGPNTERHFGLLYPNGSKVYDIDLSGRSPLSEYPPLPPPENNKPYKGKIWCVVAKGANNTALGSALSYACSQGNHTCDPIQPGKKCYKPDSLYWHASYAFSSYWSKFKTSGATCSFNGLATQTIKDPSFGPCKFPSIAL